jgi:hypothetical protein
VATNNDTVDRRRYGVIETRFRQHGRIATYNLTIDGELWACIEWSPSRRAWCVQDASGRCLAHCDAIHSEHIDASTAVQLAKTMIRDGRIPTPEDARQQLNERLERDKLASPGRVFLRVEWCCAMFEEEDSTWRNTSRISEKNRSPRLPLKRARLI